MVKKRWQKMLPVVGVVIISAIVIYLLFLLMRSADDNPRSPKKKAQMINVLPPPPPPPPPPQEEEPPPEDEEIELEDEPEPEEMPDDAAADEAPAGEELGLDADGTAGSDAFGLLAKKGGRGLLAGGNPFAWYSTIIEQDVLDYLSDIPAIRKKGAYRTRVDIWFDADGNITAAKIIESTDDKALDSAIEQAVMALGSISKKPPPEMNKRVSIEIIARI
ncbi:MAG: energy transducer TonB [Gammaproteobacteria bacterium]|nr:energy transducer TonB [Gammaproteobacteria bacterium]MBQ0840694.1 energy transducer TonB [Gammaproteobacteria bacterium]